MNKTVLVSGANGFIGRHTLPLLLERGYNVHALLYPSCDNSLKVFPCQYHVCDLFDFAAQKKIFEQIRPVYLIHFAWITTPKIYWTSFDNFRWVQASLELFRNFIECGGKRILCSGTCAEYDWVNERLSETTSSLVPRTFYGICKRSLSELLFAVSRQTKVSSAWGRIFFVYGPHEHKERLVPSAIHALLGGNNFRCFSGEQKRDFLFVEDVAAAFVALLESQVEGAVNIASGAAIPIRELLETLRRTIATTGVIEFFQESKNNQEPPALVADIKRLEQEVHWRPRWTIEEGLRKTVQWHREVFGNL